MKNVKEIIRLLQETSSTNSKIVILKSNADNELLKKVLEYTYNPHKKYGVSEEMLDKLQGRNSSYKDIFELLDVLSSSNINDALRIEIGAFKNNNIDNWDLFRGIILKDLRCNISAKTVNKVWKDLIPTGENGFDVKCMLASKFDFEKPPAGTMYISEKLDGIRSWIVLDDVGNIDIYTRQGKLIEGCLQVEESISKLGMTNVILDGELLANDCDYETVYKETIKRIKNKNKVKTGVAFHIFDIIHKDEHDNKKSILKYSERRKILDNILEDEFLKVVKVLYKGNDMNKVLSLLDEYRKKGSEGLMCNTESTYQFKRSKSCLKLKVFSTCDLKIVDFEEGTGKYKNKLGALVVSFKGNRVGVGSGFSDKEREDIYSNREELLGRVVEVGYFEITKDKNCVESLRFPTFKGIREPMKEVSYE